MHKRSCARGFVRCSITDGAGEDTRFTYPPSPSPLIRPCNNPFRVGRFMFVYRAVNAAFLSNDPCTRAEISPVLGAA